MATTPRGLPYPASTDTPDVPADIQALAEAMEDVFDNQPYCSVQNNTTQSISTASWTAATFDTDNSDAYSMHSTSSNTSRIIAPAAGLYIVTANFAFASNGTGTRKAQLRKNAAGVSTSGTSLGHTGGAPQTALQYFGSISAIVQLAASDYVELFVYQDSGGSLATVASTSTNLFHGVMVARFA